MIKRHCECPEHARNDEMLIGGLGIEVAWADKFANLTCCASAIAESGQQDATIDPKNVMLAFKGSLTDRVQLRQDMLKARLKLREGK